MLRIRTHLTGECATAQIHEAHSKLTKLKPDMVRKVVS